MCRIAVRRKIVFYILSVIFIGAVGFTAGARAVEPFRDCADCPIMVTIPPGNFVMGSSWSETAREKSRTPYLRERPEHSVIISKEFALGQYAVTRGEFAAFVRDTGYATHGLCYGRIGGAGGLLVPDKDRNWRNPGFPQTDQHPVVCVSFEDAQQYVQWLSRRTGKSYRLPTEAEWEYAARAGTKTTRFWGDGRERACEFANVVDFTAAEALRWWNKDDPEHVFQCRDGYVYTAPVGSFRPNPFGLFDMLGNVWQWVEDCAHKNYVGAPSYGFAWLTYGAKWITGDCNYRVLRGGSWHNEPKRIRSASRSRSDPNHRVYDYVGFRVARTLTP